MERTLTVVTYGEWNKALIGYITQGFPSGASIFLDVNDDILEDIGQHFFGTTNTDTISWTDDFKHAVRAKCVEGSKVQIYRLYGYTDDNLPKGVAFLAAMVLAAYYMGEDEVTTSINYFTRLRELLHLQNGRGRPDGMEAGSEERLWVEWGGWLQKQGFLPTAQAGSGTKIYVNYPISQSLLRRTDRERLYKLFEERNWPPRLDQNIVLARLRRELFYLPKHINSLLQDGNIQRYQSLSEALHAIYEEWVTQGYETNGNRDTRHFIHRDLFAELYRLVDLSTVSYYFYPRQPRRFHLAQLYVKRNDIFEELVEDRPGWYEPLWSEEVSGEELEKGAQYELTGHSNSQHLILPSRDFWILTPEPDNKESGAYISGSAPSLGTPFILLCKRALQSQITHLKNERLIEWSGEAYTLPINADWVEYRGMMVLSEAWSGVFIQNRDLYESLRPFSSLNIIFEGGIRVPNFSAWLVGYGPKATVISFHTKVHVSVKEVSSGQTLLNEEVTRDKPIVLQWSVPGDYVMEASSDTQSTERLIKILSWEQLSLSSVEYVESTLIGSLRIYGAVVEQEEEII